MCVCVCVCVAVDMYVCRYIGMDEWTDRQMDGRMDEWTAERIMNIN